MKLGLLTPVVSLNPRAHASWEVDAGIDEIVTVATAADRAGYHHLTCSEHIAVPADVDLRRGTRYWDPLALFGHLAAHTTTIRFATHVLVLGYHHPLDIAKRYGTLDAVSGGRVILGVGVGSLAEEFDLLGASFADRGPRADEALTALRATFGTTTPEHHGDHYDYANFVVDPGFARPDVPIWVGGRTARSLRRALEHGDGWVPFGLGLDEVASCLDAARDTAAREGRRRPFEIGLWPEPVLDPLGDAEAARRTLDRCEQAGATMVNARFRHDSVEHLVEQIEALAELEADRAAGP